MENNITILDKTLKNYVEDPESFIEDLTEIISDDSDKMTIVLRGIWKSEVGKKKLKRSSVWNDGEITSKKLSGTSGILIAGDWDYTPARIIADEIKQNALTVLDYGDTDFIAVVRGYLQKDEIFNDLGEAVISSPEVLAYIKRN